VEIEILKRPANTAARVVLGSGESFTAEGGAMIAMSADIQVDTHVSKSERRFGGKLGKGFSRMLAGEGFFLNRFTAGPGGGEVYLATALPGDMQTLELDGSHGIRAQATAFVAHEDGVSMNVRWEGLRNILAGESMVWLEFSGTGKVVISAFGMLYPVEVRSEYVVDTGNVAAFDDSLSFNLTKAGASWIASILGGEGVVSRFEGTGTIWCQTHADRAFGTSLTPHLRSKKQ
jgi:uncharacterized protein (TIGR00266 family)